MMRSVIAWASLSLLAGCGATPKNQYFVLSAAPARDLAESARASASAIHADVHLPGLLDRAQIVVRDGPHSVDILEFERWGEPLDEMIPSILNQDLQSRSAAGSAGAQFPTADRHLSVTIDQFIAERGGQAVLAGRWHLIAAKSDAAAPAQETPFMLSAPLASTGGADIAAAMSGLLGQLADRLTRVGI